MHNDDDVLQGASPWGPAMGLRGAAGGFPVFDNSSCVWPRNMAGQPGAPLHVLLVDSDRHARGVIAQELMADARTVVAGQAPSLREGRRLLRTLKLDVLMVDLNLADGPGFGLVSAAKALHAQTEVVVVSARESVEDAFKAFDLGAAGYVVKNAWPASFVQAVLQVANGGASVPPSLSRRLLMDRRKAAEGRAGDGAPVKLSEREQEILQMIAGGMTTAEIAGRLSVSATTVNSHVKNIYRKLKVRTRAQAVSCAGRHGLL